MLQRLRRRLQGEREGGFTLIELMVVVLIIAILIAIAIPTFLGARQRAQNRAAQSSLRNALTAAKTIYTDTQSYTGATAAAMEAVEPSLNYVATAVASGNQNTVSVNNSAAGVFAAAAMSASGTCYWIKEDVAPVPPTGRRRPRPTARATTRPAQPARPGSRRAGGLTEGDRGDPVPFKFRPPQSIAAMYARLLEARSSVDDGTATPRTA